MSDGYNRLLKRQIRRLLPNGEVPEGLEAFLSAVNESYAHYEDEVRIIERSLDISSDELLEKNEALERQNELLESFVYRVTHDLKSPAYNIQNMLAMFEEVVSVTDPMAEKIMGHLNKASDLLIVRIQDLLDLTRARYLINAEAVDLHLPAVMDDIRAGLVGRITESGAVIEEDFDAQPSIRFPKENLNSILQNLVSNAIKYRHPDRKPVVHVSSGIVDGSPFIEVRDNGLGIDLEKNEGKLFGMFNRFHTHTEGSGVGLFILKKIVDESGGRVEVQSEVGKGTCFRIWFKKQLVAEKI
ncbi:MAG: HAMP domain-containing sensor histidine kinase [Bacteroidota bacterium]